MARMDDEEDRAKLPAIFQTLTSGWLGRRR